MTYSSLLEPSALQRPGRRDDPVRRATQNQFVVILNWFEELKQQVPGGR